MHSLVKVVCLTLFSLSSINCLAETYRRDNYRDIKMLGRGGAGVAVVDGGQSAFFNPAGIGATKTYNIQFIDSSFGLNYNFRESFGALTNVVGGGNADQTLSQMLEPLVGLPLRFQGGIFPHIAIPNFMFGVWDYFDGDMLYRDPVYPRFHIDGRNDSGLIMGTGGGIMDRIFFGASLRYQKRREVYETLTADSLLGNYSTLLTTLQKRGEGFGLNVGMQAKQPLSGGKQFLAVGVAVEDVGYTRFKNATRLPPPRRQNQAVNAGVGYGFNTPLLTGQLLLDVKRLQETNVSYTKRIHTGIELSTLMMDFRGGLYQGYWAAGWSLRLGKMGTFDLSSYGEELGAIAGQQVNRIFLMGFTLGIELKKNQGKQRRFTLDKL